MNMRFLVLTKSAKHKNLCVAGVDLETYKLVRLVSNADGKELSSREFCYNGQPIDILSEINITCSSVPLTIQTENYLLQKINSVIREYHQDEFNDILKKIEQVDLLSGNSYYVSPDYAHRIKKSLMVAEVNNFATCTKINNNRQKRTKASFYYNRQYFNDLSVTDPDYFNQDVTLSKCKVVLSISEAPFGEGDRHYIFVAKIFSTN